MTGRPLAPGVVSTSNLETSGLRCRRLQPRKFKILVGRRHHEHQTMINHYRMTIYHQKPAEADDTDEAHHVLFVERKSCTRAFYAVLTR